jgi:signal transduction histidine kinase
MTRRNEKGEPCGAIGLVVDVTDRVRAEKDRRAIETQMQHTQKLESLGVLAGGVAHDFNNLLMAVLGNADLVLADLPGSGQARGKVERIQRAARAASHLTQQLLSYAGTGELDAHPLDLSSLVAEMTDLLLVSISKKAELRCDLADGLPPVDADAARMTQVILNLVINASDALGDEHGEIRVRTGFFEADRECAAQAFLHGDLEEGPYLFLEVSDTGVGMDEVTRSRIFDPFFTTKFVGRGLGLATTLGIVRGHGGTVSVYSEPGEGTRFRVLLPCAMGATAVRRAPPAVEVSWKASGTLPRRWRSGSASRSTPPAAEKRPSRGCGATRARSPPCSST